MSMIRFWLLIIGLVLPLSVFSQQRTSYNQKGDEAYERQDYRDAQMWYEEGVQYCDAYSISQLTTIWMQQEDMRPAMYSLMIKCLDCLNEKANEKDTTAISQLIVYYKEGIGTPKNDRQVQHWAEQLDASRNPVVYHALPSDPVESRTPMTWFAGYHFSPEAPYGITIGGIWDRVGWYVRVKTNFSFVNHTYDCDDKGNLTPVPSGESTQFDSRRAMKTNSFAGTGGIVGRLTSWLYLSAGLGYGERALMCPFILTNYDSAAQREVWCYNNDSSYKGIVAECDLMVRYRNFFVSGGVNTINFEYVDLNAGVGYFF